MTLVCVALFTRAGKANATDCPTSADGGGATGVGVGSPRRTPFRDTQGALSDWQLLRPVAAWFVPNKPQHVAVMFNPVRASRSAG